MLQKFEQTMLKLSLLGFSQSALTDCSDVIPTATGTVADPFIPAGLSLDDIESACSSTPFPSLPVAPGASPFGVILVRSPNVPFVVAGAITTIPAV